jgi:predicted RNase H-like HicB family nuclease
MAKIVSLQSAITKQAKVRYIITIDEDETPVHVARELKPGVITIMITARTPEEAETMRKEAAAIAKQQHKNKTPAPIGNLTKSRTFTEHQNSLMRV